jgi:acyl-CoA reductase-like NAD-dependent aldehyde dehydrogenase
VGFYDLAASGEERRDVAALAEFAAAARAACRHGHTSVTGGVKDSGAGAKGGWYSMQEMTELKWVTVQLGQRRFSF